MDYLIKLTGLNKKFADNKVLDNLNLTIRKSERIALLGASGAGKTTLLRIVAGLEKPTSGKLQIASRKIGYVFQEPRLIPWRTVEENLLFVNPQADPSEILDFIKLADYRDYYPHQLSGGMKQRVNLARALIINPDLLLLDEAFSSLDLPVKLDIIQDLLTYSLKRHFTIMMVTHDLKEALLLADRIIILSARTGEIIKDMELHLGNAPRKISDANLLERESDILQILINLD